MKTPIDTYGEWEQFERNGFWFNKQTGEETLFHPACFAIANQCLKAHERLVKSIKRNPPKGIKISRKITKVNPLSSR